jgi:hypothetical protein
VNLDWLVRPGIFQAGVEQLLICLEPHRRIVCRLNANRLALGDQEAIVFVDRRIFRLHAQLTIDGVGFDGAGLGIGRDYELFSQIENLYRFRCDGETASPFRELNAQHSFVERQLIRCRQHNGTRRAYDDFGATRHAVLCLAFRYFEDLTLAELSALWQRQAVTPLGIGAVRQTGD